MRQSYRMIPVYTADVSGVCSALYELGGMTVMHDPSGCNSTYNTHDEIRWYDQDSLIFISGLTEIDAIMGLGCEPVVDGRFQVKTGPETLAADEQHHIPYLIGFTSEDIVPPYLYQMAQDWCARNADSYGWFFDRQLPGDDRGAWHSSDLWYWFGTLAHCWRPFTEKDTALSAQMVDYLTNFAKTGDPNGANLPQWQTVTAQQTDFLRLGEEPTHMGSVDVQKLLWTMQNVPAVGE